MTSLRYLTLLWPGLPWLWLRGSIAGVVLALAFAVVLDVSILFTWIWSEVASGELVLGLWVATGAVWSVATLSAITTFPPPLPTGRDDAAEALFVAARDAYLARDWLGAETKLRGLLVVAPTDGEAQLLLATLLRRVGRRAESRTALERLAASDAGRPWRSVIRRELVRLEAATAAPATPAAPEDAAGTGTEGSAGGEAIVLPLPGAVADRPVTSEEGEAAPSGAARRPSRAA